MEEEEEGFGEQHRAFTTVYNEDRNLTKKISIKTIMVLTGVMGIQIKNVAPEHHITSAPH